MSNCICHTNMHPACLRAALDEARQEDRAEIERLKRKSEVTYYEVYVEALERAEAAEASRDAEAKDKLAMLTRAQEAEVKLAEVQDALDSDKATMYAAGLALQAAIAAERERSRKLREALEHIAVTCEGVPEQNCEIAHSTAAAALRDESEEKPWPSS